MRRWAKIVAAIDRHPRTGWYIAVIVTINLFLHLFDVKV